jgi:uncharacterized protein
MRIVVIGFTGYAGGHIAAELLERGHEVVGVARHPDSEAAPAVTEAIEGSVLDTEALATAASGADAIVVAVPARGEPGASLADAVPGLLELAGTTGARLGIVGGASGLRVAPGGPRLFDTDAFPDEYRPEAAAGLASFDALVAAGPESPEWFYLSPAAGFGSYDPGERTGRYRTADDVLVTMGDGRSVISGADYAIAFADELERPAHHRSRFTVGY